MRLTLWALVFVQSTLCFAFTEEPIEKPIFVGGSSSVAELLKLVKSDFENQTKQLIQIRSMGSDKGIEAIANNLVDIATSSRYLTKSEQQWPHLKQVVIAQDALVFFINDSIGIKNLSIEQLKNIYIGKYTRWSDVSPSTTIESSQDDAIHLFSKSVDHGTFDIFLEFLELDYLKEPNKDVIKLKNEGNKGLFLKQDVGLYQQYNQALGIVQRVPNAIAYDSFGAVSQFENDKRIDQVQILSLDGIAPNDETIKNGQYSFVRPLVILINTHSTRSVEKAQLLLNYLAQPKIKQTLLDNRYLMLQQF